MPADTDDEERAVPGAKVAKRPAKALKPTEEKPAPEPAPAAKGKEKAAVAEAKEEAGKEQDGKDEPSVSDEEGQVEKEEGEEGEERPAHRELPLKLRRALGLRAAKNRQRPHFTRQESHRYKRLGDTWRRPRGMHSKLRRHWSYHPNVVSIGFRGPKAARGLHPSGF